MQYKFEQLFEWSSGKPIVPTSGSIPIYGSNGIVGYTNEKKYRNKIILGRVGAYCGSVAYCPDDFNATDNTLITSCDESKICYHYAYYLLKKYQLNDYAGGAAQPLITQGLLKHLKCEIPSLEIQQKIVSILSTYDNLIENNNKQIKTLEQMAENIYKEWFVRFRFPGHETTPLENGIPKGWCHKRISDFYETSSGGTPSRERTDFYENGTIPWIKTGELQDSIIIETEEKITETAVKKSAAKIIPANSILMAMYGVNIGMLAYTSIIATCNQACCVFKDKKDISTKHYLFYFLKSIRNYLLTISFGAAQQNISQDLIKRIKILVPNDSILKKFESTIDPIYNHIIALNKQNQNLIKQRDLLLPRLMSSKLVV